ncbi:MAG TPA: hypothetical protein VFE47_21040 [Tepidisphaeraceae bacterium]|jgi:hypothetical protein|nr:hypothetical protein [Tepidisphaeraceae bacterium]
MAAMAVEESVSAATIPSRGLRSRAAAIAAAITIFAALSLYCGIRSEGFISADACTHFMAAKYAFSHPLNFVDVWNRPLVTMLYAVPAHLQGRTAVRIVCMLVAIGCGIVAFRIAVGQGLRFPVLALILTLGQPLVFLHSFGEMTELPFALLFGGAFLAWQNKRYWFAAILVAWTPLARPEGFGFLLIAGIGLVLCRKWRQLLVLPLPILLWDLAGWIISHHSHPWWRWLPDSWPYSGGSAYGRGYLLTFVALLPAVVSPLVLPATLVGIWRSLSFKPPAADDVDGTGKGDHPLRFCIFLTAAIPMLVLGVHSLFYWLGKMASDGEARYLLAVAPFWGVLSARGWEQISLRMKWRHPLRWAAAAIALPILVNLFHPIVPVRLSHDWASAREMARWYQNFSISSPGHPIIAAHPGIFYFLQLNSHDSPDMAANSLHHAAPGTILIWDPIFSDTNASADEMLGLDEILHAPGWKEISAPDPYEANLDSVRKVIRDPNDPRSHWHVFVQSK